MKILRFFFIVVYLLSAGGICFGMEVPAQNHNQILLTTNLFDAEYTNDNDWLTSNSEDSNKSFLPTDKYFHDILKDISKSEILYHQLMRYVKNAYVAVRRNPKRSLTASALGAVALKSYHYRNLIQSLFSSAKATSSSVGASIKGALSPSVEVSSEIGQSAILQWGKEAFGGALKFASGIAAELNKPPKFDFSPHGPMPIRETRLSSSSSPSPSIETFNPPVEIASVSDISSPSMWKRNTLIAGGAAVAIGAVIGAYFLRKKMLQSPEGQLSVQVKKLRRFVDLYQEIRKCKNFQGIINLYHPASESKHHSLRLTTFAKSNALVRFYYDVHAYSRALLDIEEAITDINFLQTPDSVVAQNKDAILSHIENLQRFVLDLKNKVYNQENHASLFNNPAMKDERDPIIEAGHQINRFLEIDLALQNQHQHQHQNQIYDSHLALLNKYLNNPIKMPLKYYMSILCNQEPKDAKPQAQAQGL